jgi:hypothetical protein
MNKQLTNDRIITNPEFIPTPPKDLLLDDTVLVYSTGKYWRVISIDVLISYPIIYDNYYDHTTTRNDKYIKSNISLTFCPYSFTSIVYFDKIGLDGHVSNNSIVFNLIKNKRTTFTHFNNEPLIRKGESKIMILRNAITLYPDCHYLNYNIDKKPIIKYEEDRQIELPKRFHPKTFIYGIEYNSKHVDKYNLRYSVIVSDDASLDKVNSFDIRKNKYQNYFNKFINKIRDKGGIITPSFWFAWISNHSDSKVIKL